MEPEARRSATWRTLYHLHPARSSSVQESQDETLVSWVYPDLNVFSDSDIEVGEVPSRRCKRSSTASS